MKNKNRKIVLRYLLIMLISGLIGGIIGGLSAILADAPGRPLNTFTDRLQIFYDTLMTHYTVIYSIITLLMVCACIYSFIRTYLFARHHLKEDDDYLILDRKFDTTSTFVSVSMISILTLFGIYLGSAGLHGSGITLVFLLLVFVLPIFIIQILQVKLIHLIQKHNPEKQGHPLDSDFAKKWLESCDEAERLVIYQASYKTYHFLKHLFTGGFIALLLANIFFTIGALPYVILGFFWLAHTLSYCIFCIRMHDTKLS